MATDGCSSHCKKLDDCPAVKWPTELVSKWLETYHQSKWIKFLIDELKLDGTRLLSLRRDDLMAALSSGYEEEDLDSLMDCVRSFRMEQLCNPNALQWRYLSNLLGHQKSNEEAERKKQLRNACSPQSTKLSGEASRDGSNASCSLTMSESTISEPSSLDSRLYNSTCEKSFGWPIDVNSISDGEKSLDATPGEANSCKQAVEEYPDHMTIIEELEKDNNDLFIARVSHWVTPNMFFLATPRWDMEIRQMETSLTKYSHRLARFKGAVHSGTPCCVQCQKTGLWLRGLVVKPVPEEEALQVECVDHGYVVNSLSEDLRKLPGKMSERPPLTLRCKLENGVYHCTDEDWIRKLRALDFVVAAKIVNKRSDKYVVNLFYEKTKKPLFN